MLFVVVATVFWVVSIVDCAVQPESRHRGVSKRAWVFIVLLLPVIGGVLYFTIGRQSAKDLAQRASRHAPDDDPEFLRSLNASTSQDERIRRLQEELASLDEQPEPAPDTESPSAADDAHDPTDGDWRDQRGS